VPQNVTINAVELFVILVATATAAALVVRRIALPYTVVLVVLGLLAALIAPGSNVKVPSELILTVFLPGLVFEGGYRVDLGHLRRIFGTVVLLAIPGVLISAVVVGYVLNLATGMPIELGFLVGAMLAATDPPAVLATIKRMRAPALLATTIEAESLFNDGTAIVLFAVALGALSGTASLIDAGFSLVLTIVSSAIIGAVGGYVASRLVARIDDHLIELSVSLVLAYGTYLISDQLHESGVIATVVAAIVFGNYARSWGMSERTQEAIDTVWEFAAFLLTALLFLLIGLSINLTDLGDALLPIGWGILAILAARALVIYLIVGGASRIVRRPIMHAGIPLSWLNIMLAAGMRGAVTVALALSLPADVPQRELLVEVAFGITLFTLIAQGLSLDLVIGPSLRRLTPAD
jgi:CPA1 family monovalent cation:H+ antiporter